MSLHTFLLLPSSQLLESSSMPGLEVEVGGYQAMAIGYVGVLLGTQPASLLRFQPSVALLLRVR
jgi:hypothetical protein